jgi:hypothetical protein
MSDANPLRQIGFPAHLRHAISTAGSSAPYDEALLKNLGQHDDIRARLPHGVQNTGPW